MNQKFEEGEKLQFGSDGGDGPSGFPTYFLV
jgi:hypothetical protein